MIRAWLKRALPIDEVVSPFPLPSTQEDSVLYESDTYGALFDDFDKDGVSLETCGRVNNQIYKLRTTDLDTNETNPPLWLEISRTRYVGLLSDLGFYYLDNALNQVPVFARGCITGSPALNPSHIAMAPVGAGGPGSRFPWDDDASYGDWSTSHELGHTFGLLHPVLPPDACQATTDMSQADSRVSPDYPNDPVYAGLDFGDWIPLTTGNGKLLPMKGIPGNWHDFMSYCPLKWIGPYTYDRIRSALLSS